jgi:hypothetical protein
MAELKEKVSSIAQNASQTASSMAKNAAETASSVAQNATKTAREAASSVTDVANSLLGAAEVNVGSNERVLSVAAGVLLFGWGLYRRGILGYGSMMLAAALWDRGVRGHCGVYSAMGKNTADGQGERSSGTSQSGMGTVTQPDAYLPHVG